MAEVKVVIPVREELLRAAERRKAAGAKELLMTVVSPDVINAE